MQLNVGTFQLYTLWGGVVHETQLAPQTHDQMPHMFFFGCWAIIQEAQDFYQACYI